MGQRMVPIMKTCSKCNLEFPATLEYFYRDSSRKQGIKNACKSCSNLVHYSYLDQNKDKVVAWEKEYYSKHAERYRIKTRRILAKKAGLTNEDWTEKQLIDTYGTDCYICNNPIDFDAPRKGEGSNYSFWPDHVIPTSRGGENTLKNVRPCHKTCNISKSDKTYEEYMLTANSQEIVTQLLPK